jgi:hypothetical protein
MEKSIMVKPDSGCQALFDPLLMLRVPLLVDKSNSSAPW